MKTFTPAIVEGCTVTPSTLRSVGSLAMVASATFSALDIIDLSAESTAAMAKLADCNMQINASLQDGHIFIGNAEETVMVEPVTIKRSGTVQ